MAEEGGGEEEKVGDTAGGREHLCAGRSGRIVEGMHPAGTTHGTCHALDPGQGPRDVRLCLRQLLLSCLPMFLRTLQKPLCGRGTSKQDTTSDVRHMPRGRVFGAPPL